ncbi:MAG: 3-methyladenine glycosylase [Candidatus Adlerbacteria bacterium]|nr:3-methyladenine glycosylase [Candidatus Adlerbacteria bacterium]
MKLNPLSRSFFDRNPAEVAQGLLGKLLVRRIAGKLVVGKIIETEAYLSSGDSAAHGFKGETIRNRSLYKEAGHAYVHAMRQYFLLDVVTEGPGTPSSVLIRAVEPVRGIEIKTDGPGKIGIAFGISRALDGVDMTDAASSLFIAENSDAPPYGVVVSPRIGISTAKDLALRFCLAEKRVPKLRS